MNILLVHPSFPGQFVYLASFLAQNNSNKVVFLSHKTNDSSIEGVTVALYEAEREPSRDIHPYLRTAEEAVLEGQAVVRALHKLKERGFVPDVVIGHTGWGSLMYIKDYYPSVPVIGYFEWFYRAKNSDACWFPDDKLTIDDELRIRTKNMHHWVSLDACDIGYTPTQWQHSHLPRVYQSKIKVIHDGIDTQFLQPKPQAKLVLSDIKLDLSRAKEIVTYVARGFEEYRGFPQFMDTIRLLTKRRPNCHVVIVGVDRVCYGSKLKDSTYLKSEVEKGGYDTSRVHFVGLRNRNDYLNILQASDAHIYLTRPFVLSWSFLEAMSVGCAVVGSATPPVEEVIVDGENGLLADFRSPEHIAMQVETLLDDRKLADRLGEAARKTIVERYSLDRMIDKQWHLILSKVGNIDL